MSNGPAVSTDEFLTGYFLIEVESVEAAVDWAARIPNARTGSVEVRPVMDIEWKWCAIVRERRPSRGSRVCV